jgi:hypothetical protein
VACDGHPNWCVIVDNQSAQYSEIDVDGRPIGIVDPGAHASLPVIASDKVHSVRGCKYAFGKTTWWPIFGWSVTKTCLPPHDARFDAVVN